MSRLGKKLWLKAVAATIKRWEIGVHIGADCELSQAADLESLARRVHRNCYDNCVVSKALGERCAANPFFQEWLRTRDTAPVLMALYSLQCIVEDTNWREFNQAFRVL